jgi:hypothetical protein
MRGSIKQRPEEAFAVIKDLNVCKESKSGFISAAEPKYFESVSLGVSSSPMQLSTPVMLCQSARFFLFIYE